MRLLSGIAIASIAGLAALPAAADALKIAMIEAASGPGAENGVLFTEGVRYGVELLNERGGFNGSPIELREYDNQSTPSGASDKLRKAVSEGARIIFSASSSAVATQIADDVRKYNIRNPGREILFLTPQSQSAVLTGEKCQFWFFRLSSTPFMTIKALVGTMKNEGVLGDAVYSINQNYSYGQDMQKAQAIFVAENGSKVVESTLHDFAKIQDFSPYVAKIKASGATTVLTGNWGSDMVLLMKAAATSGLKVTFGTTNLDNPGVVGSAGDAALGSYQASPYNPEAGGADGKSFADAYKARFGHFPVFGAQSMFLTMLLGEALKSVQTPDGNIDTTAIALALEDAKVQTPMGEISVRKEDHQGLIPIAVAKITKEAKYKSDGTDMGLQLVRVVAAKDAVFPVDPLCKMARPR